jgi:hypothetical protein
VPLVRTSRLPAALVIATVIGVACAVPERAPPSTSLETCLFQSTTTDWVLISDRQLVLYGPARAQAFLAELAEPISVRSGDSMLTVQDSDGNGRICGTRSDRVTLGSEGARVSVPILSVRELAAEDLRQLLRVRAPREPTVNESR